MIDLIKFYLNIISDLMSKLWGGFDLGNGVTYMHLVVASMVLVAFITVLKLSFESNGAMAMKYYGRTSSVRNAKHISYGRHESGNTSDYLGRHVYREGGSGWGNHGRG